MFSANKKSHVISESSEYIKNIRKYFNINRPGQTKDQRNIGALERKKLRGNFNQTATNKYFYSTTYRYVSTVITAMGDFKVGYISTSSKEDYYCHAHKNFLKYLKNWYIF